jgi:hypothetical protein
MRNYPFGGSDTVWTFRTRRFSVTLTIEDEPGYRYDGDDPDGETQGKLDSGEYVAFSSTVAVALDGVEIASDHLGGSVYDVATVSDFWTGHRDPDPRNRNCTEGRDMRGGSVIGHYFPDMVRQAIYAAREHVRTMQAPPRIRDAA